jgi:hypothetical protein
MNNHEYVCQICGSKYLADNTLNFKSNTEIDNFLLKFGLFKYRNDVFKITCVGIDTVSYTPALYISCREYEVPKESFMKDIVPNAQQVREIAFTKKQLQNLVGKIATDTEDSFVSLITDYGVWEKEPKIIIHGDTFSAYDLIKKNIVIDGKPACNLEILDKEQNIWKELKYEC